VTLERPGTESERAAASASPAAPGAGSSSPGGDDTDRPRLRRQPSPDDAPPPQNSVDSDRPGTASSRPATTVEPNAVHHDPDDDGPPVLRRGKPAPRPESGSSDARPGDEPVLAAARPSVHADEVNGVT